MYEFIIKPNQFLNTNIQAFYHSDYSSGNWRIEDSIENIICTLKNDITPYTEIVLQKAVQRLSDILVKELPEIFQLTTYKNLTVCVIPRAKVNYNPNQLYFKTTIRNVVNKMNELGLSDGTDFIIRCRDTRTTHRNRAGHGGEGDMPYPGITKATCTISNQVNGKDILLIDYLYTKNIDIDEDAIQALLDNGAKTVTFY